ncbi:MAG: 50S ribosomal protein L11 methyltransferase [Methanomicrobiales archaeon]|nr:50S ribosomal protein L11 methyltransferase [Methanomicrobiales archaeon]
MAKLMVNLSCFAAWITGNARNTVAMKQRMQIGYEGTCSDHVTRYDTLGLKHYTRIATELLGGIDLRGKKVLDVGCGTGILSLQALSGGAGTVLCSDLSRYMLEQCR